MTILLLIVIYITFISLGLPDAILGVSFPLMLDTFDVPLDVVGYISPIVTLTTVTISIFTGQLIAKLGTQKLTAISVLLTSLGLLGISFIPGFFWIIPFAMVLGMGAGAIDASLNNYVSQHFKPHHMNFLHAFWGLGATTGPIIMSIVITYYQSWRIGYRTIAGIQFLIFVAIVFSYSLWHRHKKTHIEETPPVKKMTFKQIWHLTGLKLTLLTFMVYCAIELSIGLWASSYFVYAKSVPIATAATLVGVYYFGITAGRIGFGVLSFKIKNHISILVGGIMTVVMLVLLLFANAIWLYYIVLFLIGVGLAPIFPGLTHETPTRFSKQYAPHIIGYQIAFANIGLSIFPAIFGLIVRVFNVSLLPVFLLILAMGMLAFIFILNQMFTSTKTHTV